MGGSHQQTGWYVDPWGRYALRFFSGTEWTEHVKDRSGAAMKDPLPIEQEMPTVSSSVTEQDHAAPAPPEEPEATTTPEQVRALVEAQKRALVEAHRKSMANVRAQVKARAEAQASSQHDPQAVARAQAANAVAVDQQQTRKRAEAQARARAQTPQRRGPNVSASAREARRKTIATLATDPKYRKPLREGTFGTLNILGGSWNEYAEVALSAMILETLVDLDARMEHLTQVLEDIERRL